ncbi:MAG: YfbU family protein [Clostridiaceae bacterium]|jgi:uncharacterized protein YfbU (UPF0304 family)|nr:YfbU family protein [Clostridiaceae bacterium]
MELSKKDRLMLINQYRILSILNPDGASSYNIRIKMLEEGYSLHYDEMVNWINDGMSREECQEIIDILEMYRCLWHSFKKLRDKGSIKKKHVRFPGFDAKDEEKQLNYAEYVMYSLNRYKEFHQRRRLPNHDSYKPMLRHYRAMLSVWNSLGNRRLLSGEEIIQILNGEMIVPDVDDDVYVRMTVPVQHEGLPIAEDFSEDKEDLDDHDAYDLAEDEEEDMYDEQDADEEEDEGIREEEEAEAAREDSRVAGIDAGKEEASGGEEAAAIHDGYEIDEADEPEEEEL